MSMTKYAILIYEDPAFYADISPEAWPAVVDAHSTFVEQVFALGGSLAGGEALAPPSSATTVKGGGTVTHGPFVETKGALNGIYVVAHGHMVTPSAGRAERSPLTQREFATRCRPGHRALARRPVRARRSR